MYRISWSNANSSGHGEGCLTKEVAEAWVVWLSEKYPEMSHWIEDA